MRTIEKIFPGLFAAIGITIVATWFALVIMGEANMLIHILFLFATAFIFELYSANQRYRDLEAQGRREREDVEMEELLRKLNEDEPEEQIRELEEEFNL